MSIFDDLVDKLYAKVRGGGTQLLEREEPQVPGLTGTGFVGPNGGQHLYVEPPIEFEASSMQACGLWPFSVGASTPLVGAVLGRNVFTGSPVCGDPMTSFTRGIVSSPSAFVMALNGRGKSSLVVRMLLGCMDFGYLVMVLGDLKPDYVGLIQKTGGTVFRLGRGIGGINVLDAGPWREHLPRLSPAKRAEISAQIHGRRVNALAGLIELLLRDELSESRSETTILSVAIGVAAREAEARGEQPLPRDVLRVITERHPEIRSNILEVSDELYDEQTKRLRTGLNGLGPHGPFGDVFANHTTNDVPLDRSINFDVSSIGSTDTQLRAAVQLACWSYGQAVASCAKTLAEETDDAGQPLEPERHHVMVMDELWQILEAWDGSVYRINSITKINRTEGLGQIMITHSMKDLELSTTERTKIARGFVERSAMLYLGGLARNEMADLVSVKPFSEKEKDLLVAWSAEGTVNPANGKTTPPLGRGKFLLKTGDQPGIAFSTGRRLTAKEHEIHDTNSAWRQAMSANLED